MIAEVSFLTALLRLVDQIPFPDPSPRGRGRPPVYSDRLIVKALVIMVVKHLPRVHTLLAVLAEPEMAPLRACLTEQGTIPSRRTWERRLDDLPATLPTLIRLVGHALLGMVDVWPTGGAAVAIDSTVLKARGGVWHQKDRRTGTVPHSSIDIDANWTKSGWHGWVYGWKLHLVTTVSDVWLPLAADLTPANTADNVQARTLLTDLPPVVHAVLGDCHYDDPALWEHLDAEHRLLITTKRGKALDAGVEVRRMFQQLRSHSIEPFNQQFKDIFDVHRPVSTKGRLATTRSVLGAVLVYQLALWYQHERNGHLRRGLKSLLLAA